VFRFLCRVSKNLPRDSCQDSAAPLVFLNRFRRDPLSAAVRAHPGGNAGADDRVYRGDGSDESLNVCCGARTVYPARVEQRREVREGRDTSAPSALELLQARRQAVMAHGAPWRENESYRSAARPERSAALRFL
jgi:hypothetical protein